MAKTEVQALSVVERLRAFLKLEDRFNHLDRTRRPSAKAMRAATLRVYPEERLRTLHRAISDSVDGGVLPGVIRRIQRDIIASPRYSGFAPPAKVSGLFVLDGFRGLEIPARDDMARFRTHVHEVYSLAVLLSTEDPEQAGSFGTCDDPDAAMDEMADLTSQMGALKEDLRIRFGGDDIAYGDVVLVGGRRMAAATWRCTNGEVEFGAPVESLINWARQHRRELGVS